MESFNGPETPALLACLRARQPLLWTNHPLPPASSVLDGLVKSHALGAADIEAAATLLERWRPALVQLFPELTGSGGLIESPLIELTDASHLTGVKVLGRTLIKSDHALPVAGSIKARGGIYEVLAHAEQLGAQRGWLPANPAERTAQHVLELISTNAKALFARHTIAVGSTGNLGLSIGIMAAALGFRAVVHMSHDAKAWKKTKLRQAGVEVIEHHGDYAAAVAAGRAAVEAAEYAHFVDDENSRNLFLGYAVAALRLQQQLAEAGVAVDAAHPLFVYLPCGVGGAPGGITFGLKHVFGDAVSCFFAEPCASPAMLVRMSATSGPRSVYDIGLDNRTEADGLAVAEASELVYELTRALIAGVYTVADERLFKVLAELQAVNQIRIEPSSAAAFCGLALLTGQSAEINQLNELNKLSEHCTGQEATHLFWTTGGAFVPPEEYEQFVRRGQQSS